MEQFATFQSVSVFAELGAVLAGFGSLGSVLSARRGSDHPKLDALRLRNLVEGSAILALGGLLPMVLGQFNLTPHTVWRIASAFFLTGIFSAWLSGILRAQELKRCGIAIYFTIAAIMSGFLLIASLLLLINLCGFYPHLMTGFYFLALLLHTSVGFILFIRTFSSLFKRLSEEAS